jgi:integrase
LREERRLPATLTLEQVGSVIHDQKRLRDRFLFAVLFGTGMRVGQALGLRHEDVVTQDRRIAIVAREDNANGARGKRGAGCVPVTGELVRCYSDYMHVEYGDLDSDYVFVNLWGGQVGRAMSYANVNEIVSPHPYPARVSLHPAHVPAHVRDGRAAWRGADRDRQQAADAQLDPDHLPDLSAFLAGGSPRRA